MSWNTRIREAFESTGHHIDDAVVDELAEHAQDLYEQTPIETREAALEGQIASWVAEVSERPARSLAPEPPTTGTRWLTGLPRDIRYALRVLRRAPGPTAASMLTIAIGVAAVTVMASLVWGVLLRPLPWPDASRLVRVYESRQGGASTFGQFGSIVTNGTYLAWQEAPSTIDAVGAWSPGEMTLSGAEQARRLRTAAISPSLFAVLRVAPQVGRAFHESEARPGSPGAVLISQAFWQQQLGGQPKAIGRVLRLDGEPFTIVGVMRPDFVFPDRETTLWLPMHVPPTVTPGSKNGTIKMFSALARLKTGVSIEQASAEARARAQSAPQEAALAMAVFGSAGPAQITLVPVLDDATRQVMPALLVLLAAVCLLLLAASGNVANVQLARATSRRREFAIRCSLGADRNRVAWQLVLEAALVGVVGGVVGLAVAAGVIAVLPDVLPADFPRVEDIRLDLVPAMVALAASLLAGVAAGVLPALLARRLVVSDALADDNRAPTGMGRRSAASRTRGTVMAAQVAVATVLLVGAGLLTQAFLALLRTDRGFETTRVLTAALPLPGNSSDARRRAVIEAVVERIAAVPGVVSAGYTGILPLTGSESIRAFDINRPGAQARVTARVGFRAVSVGYFHALGMRLVDGRFFGPTDTETSGPVAVVNRAFARTYLDDTPLGEVVPVGTDERPDWIVIGVVEDIRTADGSRTGPEVFVLTRQWGALDGGDQMVTVRTAGDPLDLVPVMRGIIRDIDPALALGDVTTMEGRVLELLAKPRLYSVMLAGFAASALGIAAVGLFGVLSFSVAQRSRELAVRSALGATPASLVRLVLRQGLTLTWFGLVAGVALSLSLAGSLGQQLYGVNGRDPATYTAAGVFLLVVSAVACVAPALRAARLDPVVVLKSG